MVAGLDMYVQNGQWEKAIETAEQQVHTCEVVNLDMHWISVLILDNMSSSLQNPKVLHKYVAMYAANLIKEKRILDAMDLYNKHGTPALPQVICSFPLTVMGSLISSH